MKESEKTKIESKLAKAYKDGGKAGYQAALNQMLTEKPPIKAKKLAGALNSLFL